MIPQTATILLIELLILLDPCTVVQRHIPYLLFALMPGQTLFVSLVQFAHLSRAAFSSNFSSVAVNVFSKYSAIFCACLPFRPAPCAAVLKLFQASSFESSQVNFNVVIICSFWTASFCIELIILIVCPAALRF